jgi:hypothetical protein
MALGGMALPARPPAAAAWDVSSQASRRRAVARISNKEIQLRNAAIFKFFVFAMTLTTAAFAAREASALETISQSSAAKICQYHGGLVTIPSNPGAFGCSWCGPHTCTSVVCDANGCTIVIFPAAGKHPPIRGVAPVPGGSVNPPKGTNPVGVGGVNAPNSGVNEQPGGSNQPVTIERNNSEPSGGRGGGHK